MLCAEHGTSRVGLLAPGIVSLSRRREEKQRRTQKEEDRRKGKVH